MVVSVQETQSQNKPDHRPVRGPDCMGLVYQESQNHTAPCCLLCNFCAPPPPPSTHKVKQAKALGSPSSYLSQQSGQTPASQFPPQNDSSFNSVWFSSTYRASYYICGFLLLVSVLPTTELNYESLAGVWKYIIKKPNTSTVLFFGRVCVHCSTAGILHL